MLIDWERLRELCQEIGADDFNEIIEVFLDEVAAAIQGLDPRADLTALEGQLHFLKSSSLNLGFAGLASVCKTGECLAASGCRPVDQIATIPGFFQESLNEFRAGRTNIYTAA